MKLDINMPNSMHVAAMTQPWEHKLTPSEIARTLRLADELGYWKVMLGEHFVVPRKHVPLSGDHYLSVVTALAFAASLAPRMKLSSSVVIAPLQNPIVQAKAWSTLDWLSGGRAVMLAGVGWLEEEYEILGVPFHERGRLCDEYIAAMIELWTKEAPAFEGKYVRFKDVGFAPKPVQKPHVPIWFGGDADGVLRRVARFGSGWSPFQTPPEKFPERLDFIYSQPFYRGQKLEVMFALSMLNVGEAHAVLDHPDAVGVQNAQKIIDQCGWMASLGVTETVLPPPPLKDFEAYLDWLRWVSADVMPKIA